MPWIEVIPTDATEIDEIVRRILAGYEIQYARPNCLEGTVNSVEVLSDSQPVKLLGNPDIPTATGLNDK